MSLILNIETSTSVCSVALSEGEEVVFEKASFIRGYASGCLWLKDYALGMVFL